MTDPLAWHSAALAGEKPMVYMEPEAGYFFLKSANGFLPVSIFWDGPRDEAGELTGDEIMRAEIAGAACDPGDVWPMCAKRPVSKSEYLNRLFEILTGEQQETYF